MNFIKRAGVLFLFGCLTISASASAKPCRDSGTSDCFLLRAKPGDQAVLLRSYGLEYLRHLDSQDPDLILVAGPENLLPEMTEELLRADGLTIGVEAVVPAVLPETGEASAADGTWSSLESLSASGVEAGYLAGYFASAPWSGYTDQPAMDQIEASATHSLPALEARGLGSVVAVIDTGVDPKHPLLQGSLVPGYDFLLDEPGFGSEWSALESETSQSTESALRTIAEQSYTTIVEGGGSAVFVNQSYTTIVEQSYTTIVESQNLPQAFGHGTMVAGIVRLVAPAAKIMPLRVFDGDGTADLSDVVEAIRYAVRNGANVINMSFSTSGDSEELRRAVLEAESKSVVLITSTGNEGAATLTYPAAYGQVFGVASVNTDNELSPFSNYGPATTLLAAPGEEVITAFPGGLYAAAWGTSFAAPFVSGTAAMLHRLTTWNMLRIRVPQAQYAFEASSTQPDPWNPSNAWGSGVLNSFQAFANGLAGR